VVKIYFARGFAKLTNGSISVFYCWPVSVSAFEAKKISLLQNLFMVKAVIE